MPSPDFLRHDAFAAAEVAADYPDTVEFGLDFDDLPTSSLTEQERELIEPSFPQSTEASAADADFPADLPQEQHVPEHEPPPVARNGPTRVDAADGREAVPVREIGPGAVLHDRYIIEKALGVGGSSTVYSAVDRHRAQSPDEQGKVAVKVLHSRFRQDQARVFRLIREFRHMQRLTHAGIARVFDLDCDAGVWFITMELLEGQSLHRQLKDGLKEGEALRILTQCTEALAYAHDQGVMHGDLKPGNIFITRDGAVRLLDFGSVPDQDEAMAADRSPHLAATLAYAGPQLLEEQGVEPRDDLFSLGCVAYELFSGGQHPFDHQSSLQARRKNLRPADIRTMPARRFAVIAQMLAWERAARPASARDFLHSFLAADFRPGATSETAAGPAAGGLGASGLDLGEPGLGRPGLGGLGADAPDAVHNDSGSSVAAENTLREPTANERSFAAFAGVVPDDWSGPGARLPAATPRPPLPTADPHRTTLEKSAPNRVHAAPQKSADAEASYLWLRKAVLIGLLLLLVVAGFVLGGPWLSRLWQTDTPPPPVAAAPATMAPIESTANATTPEPVLETPVPEPVPSVAQTPTPAAVARPPPPVADPASLQSAMVRVGSSQQLAVVNVVREKSTAGTARVAWSIVANTAKLGVDYESPDSQIARFNDGQRVRSLYIPLKHPATGGNARAERRFTVKLQPAPGALAPGRIDRTEVIISAP